MQIQALLVWLLKPPPNPVKRKETWNHE